MDRSNCGGCEQDFYNGKNPYGIPECWHLKDAKVITRFAISINAPMGTRANYAKVRRPHCYQQKGTVYLKAIPEYAK